MAALAVEGGDVHHELRAQAAIGEAQVALGGTDLIDDDVRGGGALPGVRGGLRQQQLLHVGDPLFVDLDAGIGFAQQDVGDAQLLAQAIIVQAAQLQILYLEQALVVGPIQHVEPRDLESTAYLQLADGPLAVGGQVQPGAAGKLAVPYADAQQILQVGLSQGQRQPLLADGAVQGEGVSPRVPSNATVVLVSRVALRVRGLGWAVWLPRGPRVRARAEMARFRGLPLVASVRVRLPWSMRVCLRAHCQGLAGVAGCLPPWGSSGGSTGPRDPVVAVGRGRR